MVWKTIKEAKQKLSFEQGTIHKEWGGRIPIALVYPNTYHVGMSNLGFQTIYRFLNNYDHIVCERVFLSNNRSVPLNNVSSQPLSLESQRPLSDFAVLAFSISYELDYFNVIRLLRESGIPLKASDRNHRYPILIAGGPCITANPEPLSPFFDCLAIGEGEVILPKLIDVFTDTIQGDRDTMLKYLALVDGIYMPNFNLNTSVNRQWVQNLDNYPTHSAIITPNTEFRNMYLIEITRGCLWNCRFCMANYQFQPMRWYSKEVILESAENGLKYGNNLGLVGASIVDHPQIEEIVTTLREKGADLSVSSLRIHPISPTVLSALSDSATRTITLAPEAGSERLRKVINKSITETQIHTAVHQVASHGIRNLKLYFMIGLPTEQDEDIEALINLSLDCRNIFSKYHTTGYITINITPFIPKPGTPFQWLPMANPETLKHRLQIIKNALKNKGIQVKSDSMAWSMVQSVLARGDSNLAAVLALMSDSTLAAWRNATEQCKLDTEFYALRQKPFTESLPWSKINSGISNEILIHQMNIALQSS